MRKLDLQRAFTSAGAFAEDRITSYNVCYTKLLRPAYVAYTAQVLADVKGISLEDVAAATTANVHRLFSRIPAGGAA